jgi:S-(hydroxymethyl)glutathione dehydrogenase/alcohol dehydrogenase
VVADVGPGVTSVEPGDHVALHMHTNCGSCRWCAAGQPTLCRATLDNASQPFRLASGEPVWNFAGQSFLVEHTLVQQRQCVKLPPDMDLAAACLIGCCVLTGCGSVWNRTRLGRGDTAAVFGVGGIGLNVIQAARIQSASHIIAVDTNPAKEPIAREFGATDFVESRPGDDPAETIRRLLAAHGHGTPAVFGAGGVDYSFDCVGHPDVLNHALEALDWGGTCVAIGVHPPGTRVPVDIANIQFVQRTLTGSLTGSFTAGYDIPLIVDLYQRGSLKLDELITSRYSFDDWGSAVDDLRSGRIAARGVFVLTSA